MMVILWDMLMQTCLKHELPMIGLSKRQCMLEIEGTYKVVKQLLENVDTMYDFRKSQLYKHKKFRDIDSSMFETVKAKLLAAFRDEEDFYYMKGYEPWEKLIYEE